MARSVEMEGGDEANGPQLGDIHAAKSVADIHAILSTLQRREASVTSRLNALVASQKDLSRELGRLDLSRAQLGAQVVNTRAISNGMLADAASTATRISSAVKRLDREQANVKATLEVVEQVAELKACVLGVHGSMGAPQDWEMAATYLHRSSKIPRDVVDGAFAEEIVPTAEVPDAPRVTLDAAAESLCALFVREFEKAVAEGDGARITRFFKLFPLIGRTDIGLNAYGRYVCQGVSARARQNMSANVQNRDGFFYASMLTKLFEHIAQIVDGHEPLVERHYGTGMMVKVVERLQVEADVQGGIILDTWSEERAIDRKLTDIKSYAFSFLVQSFLPAQRPSMNTPRSGSPAIKDGAATGRPSEDEGVDMKEIGQLLSESAVMLGRWALYTRFLASKSVEEDTPDDTPLKMPDFLITSNLHKKVLNVLMEPFNAMTTFFFRRSVEKAFQLDEPTHDLSLSMQKPLPGNPPFITSAVDDVMYIVNQVIQRSLSTSQRSVVANVIPTIARVLDSDFIGMITRKMRDECYPRAAIAGALPPEDKIIAFILQINNLDVSIDYMRRIITSHLNPTADDPTAPPQAEGAHLRTLYPFAHDADFVIQQLKTLESNFTSKSHDLLTDALAVLFHQVIKPRIRPILGDTFRDVAYDSPAAAGARPGSPDAGDDPSDDDPAPRVRERFARAYNALLRPLLRLLPPTAAAAGSPADRVLTLTTEYLAGAVEKRVWGLYGRVTPLGAVALERDVGAIVAEATKGGRYGLREGFARLGQLVMVVGMDEEEWEEAEREGEGGVEWVLDAEERRRARGIVKGR